MAVSNIQRVSILFRNLRQTFTQQTNKKSSFQYDVDKTFSQKWMQSRIDKIQQQQKLHGVFILFNYSFIYILKNCFVYNKANDGVPIWWKSKADKAVTTFLFASTVACFVGTLTNLVKFSLGKL
jgi:hypothetical protein